MQKHTHKVKEISAIVQKENLKSQSLALDSSKQNALDNDVSLSHSSMINYDFCKLHSIEIQLTVCE